jgi:hypothetical protein
MNTANNNLPATLCPDCSGHPRGDVQSTDGSFRKVTCATCHGDGKRRCDCGCGRVATVSYDDEPGTFFCSVCDREYTEELASAASMSVEMRLALADLEVAS